MKYYTSDLHLNHGNIVTFANRPFRDLAHMNAELIRRNNSRVNTEDEVTDLGDFCWDHASGERNDKGFIPKPGEWEMKLNGKRIFIRGNHDKRSGLKVDRVAAVIETRGFRVYMTHLPQQCKFDYPLNFCGHVHQKWKFMRVLKGGPLNQFGEPEHCATDTEPDGETITDIVNLCVDVWDFYPRTSDEIISAYKQWVGRGNPLKGKLFER